MLGKFKEGSVVRPECLRGPWSRLWSPRWADADSFVGCCPLFSFALGEVGAAGGVCAEQAGYNLGFKCIVLTADELRVKGARRAQAVEAGV